MSEQLHPSLQRARQALEEVSVAERLSFLASEVERWMPGYRGTCMAELLRVLARWAARNSGYPWPLPGKKQ